MCNEMKKESCQERITNALKTGKVLTRDITYQETINRNYPKIKEQ